MNHAESVPRLGEYFDGTLPPKLHREIEAHLAECAACREELSSLGALLDTVAQMAEKQIEPSRDLWPEITARVAKDRSQAGEPALRPAGSARSREGGRGRIGSRGGRAGFGRSGLAIGRIPWPWLAGSAGLAVAAALILFVMQGWNGSMRWAEGVLSGPLGTESRTGSPADSSSAAVAGEIAMLEAQVSTSRKSLSAEGGEAGVATAGGSWQAFDQGLGILDQAIHDSREALKHDPHNPILQKSLLAAYQKQLELIRWASRVARQS